MKTLSVEEYRTLYTTEALRQMLDLAVYESNDPTVMAEVPKIRAALGQKNFCTAEIREKYAQYFALARSNFPHESDYARGRAEFDEWLADHDATR